MNESLRSETHKIIALHSAERNLKAVINQSNPKNRTRKRRSKEHVSKEHVTAAVQQNIGLMT